MNNALWNEYRLTEAIIEKTKDFLESNENESTAAKSSETQLRELREMHVSDLRNSGDLVL